MLDLRELLSAGQVAPTRPLDRQRVAQGIRRRRRTRNGFTVVGVAGAVAVTITAGAYALTGGDPAAQPASPSVPSVDQGRSQSDSDAARDGVTPEVAALTFEQRVTVPEPITPTGTTRIPSADGVWVASRITDPALTQGGAFYGYGEVLLLDSTEQTILRAFPLPDVPPTAIALGEDSLYCARQGDGALPTSMLCRIDRTTNELTVRVFVADMYDRYAEEHPVLPAGWTVEANVYPPLFADLAITRSADGGEVVTVTQADDGTGIGFRGELWPGTLQPYFSGETVIDTEGGPEGSGLPFDAATAPVEFTARLTLLACGTVRLVQGEVIGNSAEQACLDEAIRSGTGAELIVSSPTIEGDPIVAYYRVRPGILGIEKFVDSTRDAFGAQEWTREYCEQATTVLGIGPCVQVALSSETPDDRPSTP